MKSMLFLLMVFLMVTGCFLQEVITEQIIRILSMVRMYIITAEDLKMMFL